MSHLDLERYFETFGGGDSLPVHKPDPEHLRAAFDALPGGFEIYVGEVTWTRRQRCAELQLLLFHACILNEVAEQIG